jgi:EpsI family protein
MIRLRTIVITGTLLLATLLGTLLRPTIAQGNKAPLLATVVPKQIGEWRELPNPMVQVDISVPTTSTNRDRPYDDMVSRTYVNKQGQQIMVALAYGSQQRQEVKIHRPELCYPAQGWRVESLRPVDFQVPVATSAHIPGFRMVVKQSEGNYEAVSYWIRIGNSYSDSSWKTRWAIIKEGLQGRMTDGILVRVSQRTNRPPAQDDIFQRQEQFAAQLVAATAPEGRMLLAR